MRVLIVEDSLDDRTLLRYSLERHGCQVFEAGNGQEALELARKNPLELIISDALMPVMDGYELLRRLKKDATLKNIPFIFYSAVYTEVEEQELALMLGASAFVVKPLEPEIFWQRLQDILQEDGGQTKAGSADEGNDLKLLHKYGRIVAEKLEHKVRELARARDEWRRTFDAISDIVTVQDLDHRLLRVNQAAARMFKVSPEAAVGRYCYELFRGLSEPCPDCPVADALVTNMDFQGEIHNRKLNKIFLTTVSPLKGSDGEVRGVVHFAKDITAQKKLEEQLLQSQKMEAIGTLAGGIAHDFNNILTGIIGYTEMAENVIAPEHPGRAYLKQVLKSAERATQLIQQIMAFSRQSSPEKKPLQMQTVLKEVLKLLRASLPSSIVLEEDIADNCGVVVADATQMHQVIMNLATNARQAMAGTENGIIRFSLQPLIIKAEDQALFAGLPVGSYLQMEVSDSGIGIAEKDIKHIFDPYFTTKEKGKGTGLGLAVVHGIVNDHGGTVSVYSEPGRGTTFKIRLLALPEVKAQSIDKPNAEAPRGRERVLAVDDEEAIIIIEQRQLKQLGYQVTAFSSSLEAFEAFQKNPYAFDLVLSDMTMPGMNGVELARKILNIRPEMPIIISSGFSPLISPENARSLGVRGYLKKPFQKMELAEKVRSVLDEKG